MTESIQPPQEPPVSEFVRSFDLVKGIVGEPGKYFMVHEAKNRIDWDRVPPNYVVIEAEGESRKIYDPPYGNATFRRWETDNPTDEQSFAKYADLPSSDRVGRTVKALFVGDSFHARHWFAGEWSRYVRSEGDMAYLLKYVFDQNVRGGLNPSQGLHFGLLTQGVMVQSLQYAGRPNASVMPDAIHESLAAAQPERREGIIAKIYPSLGKALLRASLTLPAAAEALKKLSASDIVQGVELYDRAGLISGKFWTSFGIDAPATVVTPEFAPLLASKLTAPDGEGERLIREYVPYPRRAAQAYVTNVLESYAKDPDRPQRNIGNILKAARPSKLPGVTIDLELLVRETNRISTILNRRASGQGDTSRDFPILPEELTFASDAFLHILRMTRRTDISQETQIAQWQQDIHHADILGAVLGHGGAAEVSDSDVALRFPGMDSAQRALISRMMRGSAGELLRALQKQKAQRRTEPKHPDPGEEGRPYPRY